MPELRRKKNQFQLLDLPKENFLLVLICHRRGNNMEKDRWDNNFKTERTVNGNLTCRQRYERAVKQDSEHVLTAAV